MSDTRDKTKEAIDDAVSKANHATEKVVTRTKDVIDEKKSEAADAVGRGEEAIHESVNQVQTAANAVTEKVSDLGSEAVGYAQKGVAEFHERSAQAIDLSRQGFRHVDALVRANPGLSLALVFGVGIGFGFILGSAVRPKRDRWSFTR
jgi:ElaB/YqjD/DUF883 family membrane-anchored ribosome-binding protein